MGKIIQIQFSNGADGVPIMAVLTDEGRVFVSERVWGTPNWFEMETPPLKS